MRTVGLVGAGLVDERAHTLARGGARQREGEGLMLADAGPRRHRPAVVVHHRRLMHVLMVPVLPVLRPVPVRPEVRTAYAPLAQLRAVAAARYDAHALVAVAAPVVQFDVRYRAVLIRTCEFINGFLVISVILFNYFMFLIFFFFSFCYFFLLIIKSLNWIFLNDVNIFIWLFYVFTLFLNFFNILLCFVNY